MVQRILLCVILLVATATALPAETFAVAAGTKLHCRLSQTVSTKMNFQNDPFVATVTEPLALAGKQCASSAPLRLV